ncbi:HNH/ENDO VII superfamily nuclease with conserved GHE residues [Psychrobacillus psychrotolerans]|uniref:HNH/ENDO VII superfamily nuclease with conserved GHE residues n=2 Tax=Psychrobacillus TaxID=1221880 RepID=A0A1I5W4Y3_9BACI|nr:GH-E family nuclease [Psychrobacillus psychrotolerans]SFQ14677.1 HNH/ENDO VII superfamily nuclease with conserved GHE residues [Psychrobacillus psychrotolerans]
MPFKVSFVKTEIKISKTGREVIERMSQENKIQDGENKWRPLNEAAMAHKTDAVTWWNEVRRDYGPKSKEVREWMLDSNNYYLEHYSSYDTQRHKKRPSIDSHVLEVKLLII